MRIALVSRRFPPLIGGAERVLSYLAPALAAEGAEVSVLTARPIGHEAPERETRAAGAGTGSGKLTIIRLPTSRLRFVGTWIYMRSLRQWLRDNPVDLAYVSMLKHDAYAVIGEAQRLGFPVVLRPEGAGATGDVAWQGWGRFGQRIAERCRLANAFVSISPTITAELAEAGYDPSRIHALPNGVPVPEPAWNRRANWREAPRAAYVGRLAPEKGLDLLIHAWPQVLGRFPGARLTLVGEGPERSALEASVTKLGVADSVELAGAAEDPSTFLRGSDLFILPSREEGMSVALLEAMALGVPTVASSIPGNRRLIQTYKHGRLVEPENPGALAEGIIDQWSHFDRAFQMSREARARVQHEFSIKAMARKHLELFRKLIPRSPA